MNNVNDELARKSIISLIVQFFRLIKKLISLEKHYVKQEISKVASFSGKWLAVSIGGLVLLALGGLCLLVTIILVLNVWFVPWASALIVTIVLLVLGGIIALIGMMKLKKGMNEAKTALDMVGEDVRCAREK
ncbi:MAG: phage holin family protein [Deltaproteobacteria bacterium]|nr:phage holin family protein [Deltaproteobacteria bacterium]